MNSTISVSLPTSLKSFVEEQVAGHGYETGSEYVRALIRRDQDRQHLRRLLLEGVESAASKPADAAYFQDLRDRTRTPSRD